MTLFQIWDFKKQRLQLNYHMSCTLDQADIFAKLHKSSTPDVTQASYFLGQHGQLIVV